MTRLDADVVVRRGWLPPDQAGDRVVVDDDTIDVELSGRHRTIAVRDVTDAVVWRAEDGRRLVRLVGQDGALLTLSDEAWRTTSGRLADVLSARGIVVRTVDAAAGRSTGTDEDSTHADAQQLEALVGGRGPRWGVVSAAAALLAWFAVVLAGVTESRTSYLRWVDLAAACCAVQLGAGVLWRRADSAGRRRACALPLLGHLALPTGPAEVRSDDDVLAFLAGSSTAVLPRRGSAAVRGVAADGADLLLIGRAGMTLARVRCTDEAAATAALDLLTDSSLERLPTAPRGGDDLSDPRPARQRFAWLTAFVSAFPAVLVTVAGLVFDRRLDVAVVPVTVGLAGAVAVLLDRLLRAVRRPAHGWGAAGGRGALVLLPVVLVLYTLALAGPLRDHLPRAALVAYVVAICTLGAISLVLQAVLVVRAPRFAPATPLLAFPGLTTALGVGLLLAGHGNLGSVAALGALPFSVALGLVGSQRTQPVHGARL